MMKKETSELFEANEDIVNLVSIVKLIGWKSVRSKSIQRFFYLSKILYSFSYPENKNPYSIYHFTATISGPYSDLISKSISYLKSNEILKENDGELFPAESLEHYKKSSVKSQWIKTIVYIIGLYGEDKIFGFTINDPLYKDAIKRNESKELKGTPDNLTIKVLKKFQKAFEETLSKSNEIDKKEYLELYFEYVFSQIIKKKN